MPPTPRWIRSTDDPAFQSLSSALRDAGAIAFDTESDSLYHYFQKVCLAQLATPDGEVYLLDPREGFDVQALRGVLECANTEKVLHGADYDVALLKATEKIACRNVFDTMLAAKFLGKAEVGLQATLRGELGVEIKKDNQKDDWSARPLTSEQVAYAAKDVEHLLDVADRQRAQLREKGRMEWHAEECRALEDLPPLPAKPDPEEVFRDVKGVASLSGASLAIFRELIACRERVAARIDTPPFRIAVNESLLALARRGTPAEGASKDHVREAVRRREFLAEFEEAWERGVATGESRWPKLVRGRRVDLPPAQQKRVAALKDWRRAVAEKLALDPALVLPQRLIDRIAESAPRDRAALLEVPGIRTWRVDAFGAEMLKTASA